MKHFINYVLILGTAILLTVGCSSITSDSGSELDQLTETDQISELDSKTAKSKYKDEDGNGIPDVGEVVTGTYKSLYAYDAQGDWYQDLGDGRVFGTVGSLSDLDKKTLTKCDYKNQYRGTFENDPFMDSGWIKNNINCKGYDDNGNYNYLIVHETDHRYTGNPDWAIWGTWEFHTYVVSGSGNLVRPENAVGN